MADETVVDPAQAARWRAAAGLTDNGQAPAQAQAPAQPDTVDDAQAARWRDAAGITQPGTKSGAGYAKAIGSGAVEGVTHAMGTPVDLYNLVGDLVAGRGPAWVLNKLGLTGAADAVRKYGYHDVYTGSGQGITDVYKRTGLDYEPTDPGEKIAKKTAAGLTQGAVTGVAAGAAAPFVGAAAPAVTDLEEGTAALTRAPKPLPVIRPSALQTGQVVQAAAPSVVQSAGNGAVAATGGMFGGELAKEANRYMTHGLIPDEVAEGLGNLIGSFGLSGVANRFGGGYEKPPIINDYETAGVTPRFASDVNSNPGLIGKFTSNFLPDRYGAGKVSRASAGKTQDELTDYAHDILQPDTATTQQAGVQFQKQAQASIDELKQQIKDKYDDLNETVDPSAVVNIDRTKAELADLVRSSSRESVQKAVTPETYNKFKDILDEPNLTWGELDDLRQGVIRAMQGGKGNDLGLLKQVYKGIMDDMRNATASNPAWKNAYEDAANTYENNSDMIDTLERMVTNKDLPEALPDYLTSQPGRGATRLQTLFGTPAFQDIADHEGVNQYMDWADNGSQGPAPQITLPPAAASGRWLLGNRGMNNGQGFDLDKLMKFWKSASPEMQEALTMDPEVADGMARLSRLYSATGNSRSLLESTERSPAHDNLALLAGIVGTGGAAAAAGGMGGGWLSALSAPIAEQLAVRGGAGLAQGKLGQWAIRNFATPLQDGMITTGQKLGGAATAVGMQMVPEFYQPDYSWSQTHSLVNPNFDWDLNHHIAGSDTTAMYPPGQQGEAASPTQNAEWLGTADRATAVSYIASRLGPQAAAQLPTDPAGYKAALYTLMAKPETRTALFGGSAGQ